MAVIVDLPKAGPFGWGVAGDNITRELLKLGPDIYIDPETLAGYERDFPFNTSHELLSAGAGVSFERTSNIWSTSRNWSYSFIEDLEHCQAYYANVSRNWRHRIISGSKWMAEELYDRMGIPTRVAIQGVDHDVFKPMQVERPDPLKNKFVVFSGGKFEYRKGQDLVFEAFRRFQEGKNDVILMASWLNMWPDTAVIYREHMTGGLGEDIAKMNCYESGKQPYFFWEAASKRKFGSHIYFTPHVSDSNQMARMYNWADIGIFLNRCEAGTNLPLMEMLACGKPCIWTHAHGHEYISAKYKSGDHLVMCGDPIYHTDEKGYLHGPFYEPERLDDVVDMLNEAYKGRYNYSMAHGVAELTWERTAKQIDNIIKGS